MISTLLLSMPGGAEWILIIVALTLVLAITGFWIYTIVEISRSKFNDDSSKIVWILVVVLIGILGSIIYWLFGRSNRLVVNEP